MAESTTISWADATWLCNPWRGCKKVSPGCAACYMFRDQLRYGNDPSVVVRAARSTFEAPLKWDPSVVFTCSWSDWFIKTADEWRDTAWEIIRRTPQHTYLILTKRLELAPDRLPPDWPLPNVWLGTSIENARHTFRADLLRELPAERRFISAEPLLGSLLPEAFECPRCEGQRYDRGSCGLCGSRGVLDDRGERNRCPLDLAGIDWLIVGGESGSRDDARPMHPAWARELRDAALEADVAFHYKQTGSWGPYAGGDHVLSLAGRFFKFADAPDEALRDSVLMRYCGPHGHSAGRILDGREYLDRPEVRVLEPPTTTLF